MFIDERIEEALKLLISDSDFIELEDGLRCRNEVELRQVLIAKKGGEHEVC